METIEPTVTIVKVRGKGAGKESKTVIPEATYNYMMKEAQKTGATPSSKEILDFKVLAYSDKDKNKKVDQVNALNPIQEEIVKSPEEIEKEALEELEQESTEKSNNSKK